MEWRIANYAIIEDEKKVQQELQRYIREMDADAVVRTFYNSRDFELFYFQDLLNPPDQNPADKWNPIGSLEAEEIEFLRKADFEKSRPFSADQLFLSLDGKTLMLEAVEYGGGNLFGKDPAFLKAKDFTVAGLIPEALANMRKRLGALPSITQEQKILLVVQGEKGIWAFQTQVLPVDGKIRLTFDLVNSDTLCALGRAAEADSVQAGAMPPLDAIIFRYNCVLEKDPRFWVTKAATLLKKASLWPAENRPKFICLRYDNDNKLKSDFSHPFIDDLMCLPIDRLIFLQKMEIALNLPKKIKPSFLFVQEANDDIEVAKLTLIERVSDVAFSITNPVPLKVGTPAHVYFRFSGQKDLVDVQGKVIRNLPHPTNEKEHFTFFAYFALDKQPFQLIRSMLTRDTAYKLLLNQDQREYEYNPDNIFIDDKLKRSQTFAIIDYDDQVLTQTTTNIEKEFNNCTVISENSYYMFFSKYLKVKGAADNIPNAEPADLFADSVSFIIGLEDMTFQMALNPPSDTDMLMGFKAQEMFSNPKAWAESLFDNHDARELMMETLYSLPYSKRNKRSYPLNREDKTQRYVNVEFILEEGGLTVRVNLSRPDSLEAGSVQKSIDSLDAIIIDVSLLPKEVDGFLAGLKTAIQEKGISTPANGPAIIVTGERENHGKLECLIDTGIFAAIQKPIETRRLLFLLCEVTGSPFCMYNFDNIGWKEEKLLAKLARPAKMVELSEFGAKIKIENRLKVGSMLYLFGSIFKNAPDQNLCCRVYHTEAVDGEPDQYFASVIFFGITDAFLKYNRAYIREYYASKKAKEGNR